MTAMSFRSSRPHSWNQPRAPIDETQRLCSYGKLRPMVTPGLLRRLFGLD